MKRADIKAGVVYAIKASYGPPSPVVFLEDGAATLYEHRDAGGYEALPATYKASAGRGWSQPSRGYAVVQAPGSRPHIAGQRTEALAALAGVDTAAELAAFRTGRRAESGLSSSLLTSLNQVVPWDDAIAEYDAKQAADAKRVFEADALTQRRAEVIAAFAAIGIKAMTSGPGVVLLSLDEAGKLLRLVAADDARPDCVACWHLWTLHSDDGCTAKVFPAGAVDGERCPCEHAGTEAVQ
jgi:hypothetical protein